MPHAPRCVLVAAAFALLTSASSAAEFNLNNRHFKLADGFTIELAASAPLTERPICVDFDEQGRLYVAESSGTNDPVQKQLAEKPHSILRLEDTDGDGVFDKRTVFADEMMFPEGCEWHDGSLYVGAPPEIWKLTDTNDDGVADKREVWFDGQTLTGCANDLHGPYTGPDGLLYWCKGAFAEQTHSRPDGPPFVTKASHIFRHDPRDGFVEPILTGGMDNPVEVAWTRDGEPILSCTFLQRPANGQRDGLIHAVYGGVWGKTNGVLDGHVRTGDLMPPLVHLGAAAPCGLLRVESSASLNSQPATLHSPDTLLACSFNMHKVTRHVLQPAGATYSTIDDDFVVCDHSDFHPTDIIEDADGSFLLIDTGGWYKLCCPTSQLHKPDVAGAVYRIRRQNSERRADPRGRKLDWNVETAELAARLTDDRFAVRQRATDALAEQKNHAVAPLRSVLGQSSHPEARRAALWALAKIDAPEAHAAVRATIAASDPMLSRIAIRQAGLWRDSDAAKAIRSQLASSDPHTARVAAEALGRIGDRAAVPQLLAVAGTASDDRFLFHAATIALIQIADADRTRAGLDANAGGTVRASLLALDQMPGGGLASEQVLSKLTTPALQEAALLVLERHPKWDVQIAAWLKQTLSAGKSEEIARQVATRFGTLPAMSETLVEEVRSPKTPSSRRIALQAMAAARVNPLPATWAAALAETLEAGDASDAALVVEVVTSARKIEGNARPLRVALAQVADASHADDATRLKVLHVTSNQKAVSSSSFDLLLSKLDADDPVDQRLTAADVLANAAISPEQFRRLALRVADLGPMELDRVLPAFAKSSDAETGRLLAKSLGENDSTGDVLPEKLRLAFSKFDADVAELAKPILERPQADAEERAARLEELLHAIETGNARRGQQVFQSSKAACASCHTVGFLGGRVGPDLTRIGQIRTERDLLEAILYPSASFVRSYEPMVVLTRDGLVYTGVPGDDDGETVTLAVAADKTITIPHDDIEELRPGSVSIMPAGLEKQLSEQELLDLVTFLKNAQ